MLGLAIHCAKPDDAKIEEIGSNTWAICASWERERCLIFFMKKNPYSFNTVVSSRLLHYVHVDAVHCIDASRCSGWSCPSECTSTPDGTFKLTTSVTNLQKRCDIYVAF